MAGPGSSMLYSFLRFTVVLSLQEMYRAKLASSELFTILGGFISSLLFLVLLTFIGNFQETCGMRTGWGAVILAEAVALVAVLAPSIEFVSPHVSCSQLLSFMRL
ncbi:hypothetical protein SLA2020_299280 [Shorea laevis]